MKKVVFISSLVLMIIACQQQPLEVQRATFRKEAGKAIHQYSQAISNYYKLNIKKGARGLTDADNILTRFPIDSFYYGNVSYWDNFNPYCYDYSYGIQYQINTCVEMVRSIPEKRENYYFMIATLSRCLTNIISYYNPITIFGYRNLDSYSQSELSYLIDTMGWGTFDQYPRNLSSYWGSVAGGYCMTW